MVISSDLEHLGFPHSHHILHVNLGALFLDHTISFIGRLDLDMIQSRRFLNGRGFHNDNPCVLCDNTGDLNLKNLTKIRDYKPIVEDR